MKVMMLVSELEDFTIAFANGVSRHVDVVLGVPERRYAKFAPWFDPRVDLRLLDWPRHRSLRNPRFLVDLARLKREVRPDVVHLLSNTTLWLNLAAPFRGRSTLLTTVHDVDVHPGDRDTSVLPEAATSLIVRQSDHVVVHGEALRQRAVERFGKPAGRVHVLSHPVIGRYAEIAARAKLPPRPSGSPFTVLMFGRIFAYKGLTDLVAAEALLKDRLPDLAVVIAGRGDDPRDFSSTMGDPSRYTIMNRFIEDEEVARLFHQCDAVVLPYTEGSQSGVLNVAATFGKPVVVTDVGEIGRTVNAAGMGLVTPPADPAALADAIERLARQPQLRDGLGRAALAWARGPNTPAAVGAEAASLYRLIRSGLAGRTLAVPGSAPGHAGGAAG